MRVSRNVLGKFAKLIDSYSTYNPSPLSLKKFTDFGIQTLRPKVPETHKEYRNLELQSFEFLKEELLVRLALMTREMLYLPERLTSTSSVKAVHSWYLKSFEEIYLFKDAKVNEATDRELNK